MRMLALCALLLGALAIWGAPAGPALAVQPDEVLDDPALESRARDISKELRCLVCQNQSIDDSNAELARDLRVLVRERLVAGDSNKEVFAFVTDRYGDYVLLRPPVNAETMILWGGPFVLFAIAALSVGFWMRGRTRRNALMAEAAGANGLSAAEEARLAALMADDAEMKEKRP